MAWLKWPYFFQVLLNGDASRTGKAGSAPGLEMASMAAPNVDYKLWCQSCKWNCSVFLSKSPGWNPKMYVHNNLRMNERITRFFYRILIQYVYVIEIRALIMSHLFSSVCVMSHKEASLSAMIFEPVLLSHRREVRPQFTIISHHVPPAQNRLSSQAFLPLSMAGVTNTNLQPGLHPCQATLSKETISLKVTSSPGAKGSDHWRDHASVPSTIHKQILCCGIVAIASLHHVWYSV